ncbi:DUF2528 family protein [Pedobacter sp.]|uniref:DUF2528 family protein n=1 Tax=Pedobacter sp. TaxID=1411316 RepID=UPI0031E38365
MAIRKYEFDYSIGEARVCFTVDTDVFTEELAKGTLEFFRWDYDREADQVDEAMKKYALKAIELATFNNRNELGVIEDFNNTEGYAPIDGTLGILLTEVDKYEFREFYLEMEVSNG